MRHGAIEPSLEYLADRGNRVIPGYVGTMKMPKVFMPQRGTVGALEDAIGLSRPALFQPTINPAARSGNCFIS